MARHYQCNDSDSSGQFARRSRCAQAAQFGASVGPAGAAVHELRHGDPVPGGFGGVVAVQDQQPTVP
jgi:hypothetical protein